MKRDMENRDWLNDYMSLKQVNPFNPFTVPDDYFDSLTNRIISYSKLTEIKSVDPFIGFTLPENYFAELTGNIQSRIAVLNEVNNETAGFTISDDYFDTLEQQIKSRIYIEETLKGTDGSFTVPEGYFNQLNKNILNKTVNLVNNPRRTGVIRKLFASTVIKYATAACFALVLGGGILLNELNSSANEHKNSFLHKQLSGVSVDDIKSYLQLNEDAGDTQQAVATEGTSVDDNELKNALQNNVDSVQ